MHLGLEVEGKHLEGEGLHLGAEETGLKVVAKRLGVEG